MDVRELPIRVFEKLGLDPDPVNKIASMRNGGWLSLREECNYVLLELWGCELAAKHREETPYFNLYAGIREGGVYLTRGTMHRETADFHIGASVTVFWPIVQDIIDLIMTIKEMANGDSYEIDKFWSNGGGI